MASTALHVGIFANIMLYHILIINECFNSCHAYRHFGLVERLPFIKNKSPFLKPTFENFTGHHKSLLIRGGGSTLSPASKLSSKKRKRKKIGKRKRTLKGSSSLLNQHGQHNNDPSTPLETAPQKVKGKRKMKRKIKSKAKRKASVNLGIRTGNKKSTFNKKKMKRKSIPVETHQKQSNRNPLGMQSSATNNVHDFHTLKKKRRKNKLKKKKPIEPKIHIDNIGHHERKVSESSKFQTSKKTKEKTNSRLDRKRRKRRKRKKLSSKTSAINSMDNNVVGCNVNMLTPNMTSSFSREGSKDKKTTDLSKDVALSKLKQTNATSLNHKNKSSQKLKAKLMKKRQKKRRRKEIKAIAASSDIAVPKELEQMPMEKKKIKRMKKKNKKNKTKKKKKRKINKNLDLTQNTRVLDQNSSNIDCDEILEKERSIVVEKKEEGEGEESSTEPTPSGINDTVIISIEAPDILTLSENDTDNLVLESAAQIILPELEVQLNNNTNKDQLEQDNDAKLNSISHLENSKTEKDAEELETENSSLIILQELDSKVNNISDKEKIEPSKVDSNSRNEVGYQNGNENVTSISHEEGEQGPNNTKNVEQDASDMVVTDKSYSILRVEDEHVDSEDDELIREDMSMEKLERVRNNDLQSDVEDAIKTPDDVDEIQEGKTLASVNFENSKVVENIEIGGLDDHMFNAKVATGNASSSCGDLEVVQEDEIDMSCSRDYLKKVGKEEEHEEDHQDEITKVNTLNKIESSDLYLEPNFKENAIDVSRSRSSLQKVNKEEEHVMNNTKENTEDHQGENGKVNILNTIETSDLNLEPDDNALLPTHEKIDHFTASEDDTKIDIATTKDKLLQQRVSLESFSTKSKYLQDHHEAVEIADNSYEKDCDLLLQRETKDSESVNKECNRSLDSSFTDINNEANENNGNNRQLNETAESVLLQDNQGVHKGITLSKFEDKLNIELSCNATDQVMDSFLHEIESDSEEDEKVADLEERDLVGSDGASSHEERGDHSEEDNDEDDNNDNDGDEISDSHYLAVSGRSKPTDEDCNDHKGRNQVHYQNTILSEDEVVAYEISVDSKQVSDYTDEGEEQSSPESMSKTYGEYESSKERSFSEDPKILSFGLHAPQLQESSSKVEVKHIVGENDITTSIVTWNLAEVILKEKDASFLRRFRDLEGVGSDLVLIGGQETESTKPRRTEGSRSRALRCLAIKMLGKKYVPLALHSLGGVQMLLFCKRSILPEVEHVSLADVACGVGNVFHNKGGIGAFLKMKSRKKGSAHKFVKILFIVSHMVSKFPNDTSYYLQFF